METGAREMFKVISLNITHLWNNLVTSHHCPDQGEMAEETEVKDEAKDVTCHKTWRNPVLKKVRCKVSLFIIVHHCSSLFILVFQY